MTIARFMRVEPEIFSMFSVNQEMVLIRSYRIQLNVCENYWGCSYLVAQNCLLYFD